MPRSQLRCRPIRARFQHWWCRSDSCYRLRLHHGLARMRRRSSGAMIGRTTKLRRAYPTAAGAAASGLAAMIALTTGSAVADPLPPVPTLPTVTQTATVNPVAGTPLTGPSMAAAPEAGTPAQAAPPGPGLVPATTGTLKDYFSGKHVAMEPQRAQDFRALNITLPVPSGWAKVPDPNVPDAFHVIADRVGGDGLYTSNAQLVVYKLK